MKRNNFDAVITYFSYSADAMYIIFYYSIYYIMFIYMDMQTDNGCARSKVSKVPLPTILSATTVVTNIKIQSEKCELNFCINRHVG